MFLVYALCKFADGWRIFWWDAKCNIYCKICHPHWDRLRTHMHNWYTFSCLPVALWFKFVFVVWWASEEYCFSNVGSGDSFISGVFGHTHVFGSQAWDGSLSLVMDHFTFHTPVGATWVAAKAHVCKHTLRVHDYALFLSFDRVYSWTDTHPCAKIHTGNLCRIVNMKFNGNLHWSKNQ